MSDFIPVIGQKPREMSDQDWMQFNHSHPVPHCISIQRGECTTPCSLRDDGIHYDVQVDRIVPGANGGKYVASNCQPLCSVANASKGKRPDNYWIKEFWFDLPVDKTKLRPGQIEFAWKPFARVAELLQDRQTDIRKHALLLWWIVGGGKTLGLLTACSSFNYHVQMKSPACARIDRLLVLVKESALRQQLAREFETESIKYGIWKKKPVVREIKSGDQWNQPRYIEGADIVVSCAHQLWETDGRDVCDEKLAQRLRPFGGIAFDEVHYAPEQLIRVIKKSPLAVKFATTNTPIDRLGKALDFLVLYSVLDYEWGRDADKSLKSLEPLEVGIEKGKYYQLENTEHKLLQAGNESEVVSGDHCKDFSIHTRQHIAQKVCDILWNQEKEAIQSGLIASPHAVIVCDSIESVKDLESSLNSWLECNRSRFPENNGWRAISVYADKKGDPKEETRLFHNKDSIVNPWLRSLKNEGLKSDANCARILIVKDMAREGINQPLCTTIGWTCKAESMIEIIQRIGRAMRLHSSWKGKDIKGLSDVCLVWPKRFQKMEMAISKSLQWILSMADMATEAKIVDMLSFLENRTVPTGNEAKNPESTLTHSDRVLVEQFIGVAKSEKRDVDWNDFHNAVGVAWGGEKTSSAVKYGEKVIDSPLNSKTIDLDVMEPISVPCYEKPKEHYDEVTLLKWFELNGHEAFGLDDSDIEKGKKTFTDVWRKVVENKKREYDASLYVEPMIDIHINDLTPKFAYPIAKLCSTGKADVVGKSFAAVTKVIKKALSVPDGEQLKNYGPFDRPEYCAELMRTDVYAKIFRKAHTLMIAWGYDENRQWLIEGANNANG